MECCWRKEGTKIATPLLLEGEFHRVEMLEINCTCSQTTPPLGGEIVHKQLSLLRDRGTKRTGVTGSQYQPGWRGEQTQKAPKYGGQWSKQAKRLPAAQQQLPPPRGG